MFFTVDVGLTAVTIVYLVVVVGGGSIMNKRLLSFSTSFPKLKSHCKIDST